MKLHFFKLFICLFYLSSCTTVDKDNPASELSSLKKNFENGHYEYVLSKLGEYKTKYPDSEETPAIMLMLADSRFNLGEYEEAIFDYEEFLTLYPEHRQIDYAKFQVGFCYWKESSELVDQDQEFTKQAMAEWSKLIQAHPSSSYSEEAKKKILLGQQRLLGQEIFVAKYYCRTEQYSGCVYRNLKIVEKYANNADIAQKAKTRAGEAMKALIKQKQENPEDDSTYLFKDMSLEQLMAKSDELLGSEK